MKIKRKHFINACKGLLLSCFCMLSFEMFAQNVTVTGTVKDDLGETVIGANVVIEGQTSIGTITDIDGNYTLVNVPSKGSLVVSFIGFKPQVIPINGRTTIDVILKSDSQTLEEFVVVGYGKTDRATLTGALSSIETKELTKVPVASVTNVLAGSVSGVSSVQSSGQPGKDAATIYIRGSGSLSDAAGQPLVLVDGVEREFSQIDANEIESISVLKDASSTAVFGVRGANGVILVTTRRGKSGTPSINVSSSFGLQQPQAMVEQVGSYEYARFWNMRADMNGSNDKFTSEQIEAFRTGSDPLLYPNINWSDYMFRDMSLQSKTNLNISGGSDNIKYFVSFGYLYQNGILKNFDIIPYENNYQYNRYNYRANIDVKLTNTTSMKLGVGGYMGKNRQPNSTHGYTWGDPTWTMVQVWSTPFSAPGIVDGVLTRGNGKGYPSVEFRDGFKPFFGSGYQEQFTTQLNMDLEVTQKLDVITKGLSASVKGAYDNNFNLNKHRYGGNSESQVVYHKTQLEDGTIPPTAVDYDKTIVFIPSGSNTPLSYSETYGRDRNWYLEARVNYDRTFNKVHKVTGLFLYNQSRDYYPKTSGGSLASYWYMPRGYIGYVGRATYGYKNKYLFDVNVGYNGSENFAPGNRYGFFPAVSLGWVATEEGFMKNQGVFDYLKIRASVGKVGSDVGTQTRFMYKPGTWSAGGSYSFGVENANSQEGYLYGTPGNIGVSWETAEKQNYGFDARFLDSRLSANFDYFFEHRTGILITPRSLPSIIATSMPNMNVGVVDNQGYEVTLEWNETLRNDFHYFVKTNVSFARNKIIFMDEVKNNYDYQDQTGGSTGRNAGLYQYVRLYQEDDFVVNAAGEYVLNPELPQPYITVAPGDAMFADLNNDGIVDSNDQAVSGYAARPEYTFGLNAGFDFKGFNFSMQWTGATNVDKLLQTDYIIPYTNAGSRGLLKHLYEDSWTPENIDGKYPRPAKATETWNFGSGNNPSSTLWLQNSAYLRLKNVNIGYTFSNSRFLRSVGLKSLTTTLSAYNLLTFSPLKLADPESVTSNSGGYPLVKLYSFGVNLNF
ncbi:TonB-dependent receptor [Maribellus sp. YY47]|uniref:SusC/RagA family TonB-linked outer membrane protein n=1 Tax=Maribellus sp. YY47 TaxID=2929486 RepID=UPI00200175B9|nr:TonB-dependent receptor [Maribellus sp. YY47]MCK3683226.1 TonB-dependent receptor [Maribellus sp. YY47]